MSNAHIDARAPPSECPDDQSHTLENACKPTTMPQASVCILRTYNHDKMIDREAAHLTCGCDGADLSWIGRKQLV